MKRLNRLILFIPLILLVSCTDVLNIKPVSDISVNSFWTSENDARAGLNGMYVRFRDQAAYNLFWWGEGRSETLTYGLQAPEGRERYFNNNLDPTNAGPNWKGLYTVVHDANLILKYVPDIEFKNGDEKNSIMAQAHAMRAFVYFIMARTWGGVPLRTEPTEGYDPQTTFKKRASVEDVFKLIKDDIKQSLDLFPDKSISDRSKFSAPAVNALKANVYLWTGKRMGGGQSDFNTALNAINEVQKADVALLPTFADVFDFNNKKNKEILFSVHFERFESGSNYGDQIYIRGDQIPNETNQETKDALGLGGGLNRVSPSETVRDQYTDQDKRKDVTFTEIYKYNTNPPTYYASVVNKFDGMIEDGARHFVSDLILYRYADVLLMKAEAENALGQDPTPELNQVRNRAGLNDYSGPTDQASLDDAILKERLLELAFEGKRWWDLVRFGKAFDLVPSLQNRKGKDYLLLWPISEETISLNSKIEQNPGY